MKVGKFDFLNIPDSISYVDYINELYKDNVDLANMSKELTLLITEILEDKRVPINLKTKGNNKLIEICNKYKEG